MPKPHLFIGSSSNEIESARAIATVLSDNTSPVLAKTWKDGGTFEGTRNTLELILNELETSEFGAFILAPDDIVSNPGTVTQTYRTRDNVILELGLFIGHLGPERTFILCRRDPHQSVTPPSDLFGINVYNFEFDERDPYALVGPACHRIRTAVKEILDAAKPALRPSSVITQIEMELSGRRYEPTHLKIDRNSGCYLSFNFKNPTRAVVNSLHICFPPEIELNFLPWRSGIKEKDDQYAPNLRYFWLTSDQLQNVARPHGFRFLLQGRAKGVHNIKVLADIGGTIVQPEPVMIEVA